MKCIVKSSIRWASIPLLLLLVSTSWAQTVHISHCQAGCPELRGNPGAGGTEIIVRHLFAASINDNNGIADWVAYRVLKDTVGVASLLPRFWVEDNLLSVNSSLAEFVDSATQLNQPDLSGRADQSYRINEIIIDAEDQGRLTPMSSFASTPYWSELNYLSNLASLPNDLRIGSWSRLNQAINELAARIGEVFVISGPLYRIQNGLQLDASANDSLDAPAAFFKVVATDTSHAAFIFEKDLPQHQRFCDQLSSIQLIEDESDMNLFPQLQQYTDANLHLQLSCGN